MDEKKFAVGQKWKNRSGEIVEITNVSSGMVLNNVALPISGIALNSKDKRPEFTREGYYLLSRESSKFDLVELVFDPAQQLTHSEDSNESETILEKHCDRHIGQISVVGVNAARLEALKFSVRQFLGSPTPYIPTVLTTEYLERTIAEENDTADAVEELARHLRHDVNTRRKNVAWFKDALLKKSATKQSSPAEPKNKNEVIPGDFVHATRAFISESEARLDSMRKERHQHLFIAAEMVRDVEALTDAIKFARGVIADAGSAPDENQ